MDIEKNRTQLNFAMSNETGNLTELFENVEVEKNFVLARVFLVIMALAGITGNAITIPALYRSKKLQSVTSVFVVNLCVADLSYSFSTFIEFLIPSLSQNYYFCKLFPFFRLGFGRVSTNTVIAITVNRYVCVVHPSIYSSVYSSVNLSIMIFASWMCSLILQLFIYFEVWGRYGFDMGWNICSILEKDGKTPVNYLFITCLAYPGLAFLICYPRIFWIVRRSSRHFRVRKTTPPRTGSLNIANTSSGETYCCNKLENSEIPIDIKLDNQYQKEIRVLKVMLVVVIGFLICYFPICFICIFDTLRNYGIILYAAALGVNLSNVINPIIYVVMSSDYREAYMELFRSIKSSGNSSSAELTRV